MMNLKNKRILYLGPVFFYYDQYIINKLKKKGADVDTFELNINEETIKLKFIKKIKPSYIEPFRETFYNNAFVNHGYDYILMRQGYQVTTYFMENLKVLNPNAKFINFHWDSLRPQYDYLHIIKYFDKVFSFDPKDCSENEDLNYLPLFHIDEYSNFYSTNKEKKYDLLFVGAWRDTERYNLISQTDILCKNANLKFYHYLYLSFKDQYNLLRKGKIAKKVRPKSLSFQQILHLFSLTDTIIDFPSSFQTGLTIRTFEALGAGKKLITTNKNIINEPFYDPDFINVINPENILLDIDFLNHAPNTSIKEKMKYYSLEYYIKTLLE